MSFRPLVLCYHAVSERWEHQLSVSPATFERQLAMLLRWFKPVPATALLSAGGRGLHVTFDDAFRSVEAALPTLRRHGVHATIFACSAYAETGRPLDVPELAAALAETPRELDTMRWEELRQLAKDGVEIGSHTITHPHLTQLDDSALQRELVESREHIEAEIGRKCRFLAYPFGEEDARVRAAARGAGYDAAFALPGSRSPVDPFRVPRVGMWRHDYLMRAFAKTFVWRPTVRPDRGVRS